MEHGGGIQKRVLRYSHACQHAKEIDHHKMLNESESFCRTLLRARIGSLAMEISCLNLKYCDYGNDFYDKIF